MAQWVDPNIGRDVSDSLPDTSTDTATVWFQFLVSALLGNTLYFFSSPWLPVPTRPDALSASGLAALVDLWFCLLFFGVLHLAESARWRTRLK